MKYIKSFKLFEYFTDNTLSVNNDEYDQYLNMNTKGETMNRPHVVAWIGEDSQMENFKLAAEYIKSGDSLLDYGCGLGDFSEYLKDNNILVSKYSGVDINPKFIDIAKKTYPDLEFKTIRKIEDVEGKYDIICAIGVFTWYIERGEFRKTINSLYKLANKKVIITLLHSYYEDRWDAKYRHYNETIFRKMFPNLKMEFKVYRGYLVVVINKNL